MRSLKDLVATENPAWPLVQEWFRAATNPIEVLPATREDGEATLLAMQVSARSTLGAIALETGGVLVDHGWLRLLGAGSQRMCKGLLAWSGRGLEPAPEPQQPEALVVAHDVIGGFFAINGGAFDGAPGNVFYLAWNTLKWEGLGCGYTDFVQWATTGDLAQFYQEVRWSGWQSEVAQLHGDQGVHFFPFLWATASSLEARSRAVVPIQELWFGAHELGLQLRNVANGSTVRITVDQ